MVGYWESKPPIEFTKWQLNWFYTDYGICHCGFEGRCLFIGMGIELMICKDCYEKLKTFYDTAFTDKPLMGQVHNMQRE